MGFTVEEINLMCVYDTSDRGRLLTGIGESLPHLLEPELKELAQGIIGRLEAMTDREFAALVLAPDYE
ncbi:Putative tranposon-transfer assisting protein [Geosporobacter subterraneus DSM 17957]|uniref:Putative tranposon-transfer assisting protein n=1 Tax=Geosporobacter subterraneus DSM 17957 TaxID=1121919 RepID=A0A1M6HDB6_9FIRM|nr:transposon-transfer assisting family protein [Geosporobacter subterraneus]SHJ20144.1 Putative tranposon-transfer assisting protein [Geosporobacter subterraneus DSM 17957]